MPMPVVDERKGSCAYNTYPQLVWEVYNWVLMKQTSSLRAMNPLTSSTWTFSITAPLRTWDLAVGLIMPAKHEIVNYEVIRRTNEFYVRNY